VAALTSNSDASYSVENTTVSGNTATVEGGGMLVLDPVTVSSTTIANNSAPAGGGLHKVGDSRLLLRNTIVADNPGGNCGFEAGTLPIESAGGNLDSGTSCALISATDMSGADPLLGPLQNNGSRTETHALEPTSPAIDKAVSSTCPAIDQRGVTRPQNAGCDIGAYEFDGAIPPPACADGGTRTVSASADSWINQADAAKNFGTDSALKVRSAASANARALVRFELPAVPSGCTVLAAVLRLEAGADKDERTLEAVRLASSWTESGVTWTNQPATVGAAATAASGKGTVQWTVTGLVQEMYATDRNDGFLIRDAAEDGIGDEQTLTSREAGSNQPQLAITLG
jgi:hypothetical protein